jgi:hypothetical protein
MRRLLSPGWLALHVVVVVATAVMIWLGWWQWTSGFGGHTARNSGYALQWWAFAIFAVGFWIRLMRDALRGPSPEADAESAGAGAKRTRAPLFQQRPQPAPPQGFTEYRMATADTVIDDSPLGRYNAYLAQLDEKAHAEEETQ